jgi:hypothetical protein
MKHFGSLLLLLVLYFSSFSQQIHDILVPPGAGISLQQARDEFWQYHQLSVNTWALWHGNSYAQTQFGLTWTNAMAVWDEAGDGPMFDPYTRFTASAVLAYVRAWKSETDATRRNAYYDQAVKALEFLLCLQAQTGNLA